MLLFCNSFKANHDSVEKRMGRLSGNSRKSLLCLPTAALSVKRQKERLYLLSLPVPLYKTYPFFHQEK